MQKIIPHLTFKNHAEEAVNLYISVFKNSKILNSSRFTEDDMKELSRLPEEIRPGPAGVIKSIGFQLNGYDFIAVNGGPYFRFTPSTSFFVICETENEIDTLYQKLSEDGEILMPLQKYDFSKKYAWINDKFGVSWQLMLDGKSQSITPFLMFVGEHYGKAEEAVNFYTSIFSDSKINTIAYYGDEHPTEKGKVVHASFMLKGQEIMAMESGLDHNFNFTEGISLYVNCDTQEEIDHLWEKLTEGGEEQECGWLKDRYGVSWQIAPTIAWEMVNDPDPAKAQRVSTAIFRMKKLDIKELEKAYNQ